MDKDPEERREETRQPSDRFSIEGGEGDRRDQQVPPALETSEAREPDEATSTREEPFPREEERPQDGIERPLERSWWRRIFRGPS